MANCNTCGGKKKVKGMGMMNMTCPACKGTGTEYKKADLVHVKEDPAPVDSLAMVHDVKPNVTIDDVLAVKPILKKKDFAQYGK